MFRSIRWRLIISYTLLTLLSVTLVGILTMTLVERYVKQQEREFLTANAQTVAQQAKLFLTPVKQQAQLEQLVRSSALLSDVQVKISDSEKKIIADSGDPLAMGELAWVLQSTLVPDSRVSGLFYVMPIASLDAVITEDEPEFEYVVVRRHSQYGSLLAFEKRRKQPETNEMPAQTIPQTPRSEQIVTVAIGEANNILGFVELSQGRSFGQDSIRAIQQAFAVAAVGVSLLAIVLGLIVGRGLTAPIRRLAHVAGKMSLGDLTVRASEKRHDEIGELSHQFNQMAEQLEQNFSELEAERDALRNFIADASHELRTPITALRNFVELMRGAARDDTIAQADFLAESETQLKRLTWVTENLLDLSRFDAGLMVLNVEEVNAGIWLQKSIRPLQQIAKDRQLSLEFFPYANDILFKLDSERLGMVLSNLVDNALKFTPSGGQVKVGLGLVAHTLHIWVQDSGGGISAADLPHIFKRFYRSQGENVAGSGLGLAIAQSIVQAHGGEIKVESIGGKGSVFTIVLPRGL